MERDEPFFFGHRSARRRPRTPSTAPTIAGRSALGARARAGTAGARSWRRNRQADCRAGRAGRRSHRGRARPGDADRAAPRAADCPRPPGSAEAIPLPDASVDAVLAGNALHWFDMDVAGPEIARVLAPRRRPGRAVERHRQPGRLGRRARGRQRDAPSARGTRSARRADSRRALPAWPGRPVRLAGTGRVPATGSASPPTPGCRTRDEGGGAGHGQKGAEATLGRIRAFLASRPETAGGGVHPPAC